MSTDSCLVTGATGFLGRRLCRRLEDAGATVWKLTRRNDEDAQSITADLRRKLPATPAVARVWHLAGAAHFSPRTQAEEALFREVNVGGLSNLLAALDAAPETPTNLTLASSVAVYGREEGIELDEQEPRRAADPYGESKRISEDLAAEWCQRRGVRLTVVRLPLLVGPDAPGNFGAMLGAMRSGRYVGVGDGGARRSMVLVDDAAEALLSLSAVGGVFHLTDGVHPSFRELELALAAACGRRPPRRMPMLVARAAAAAGNAVQATGLSAPFTRRTLEKMTSTLTFSDQKLRAALAWRPAAVAESIATWRI